MFFSTRGRWSQSYSIKSIVVTRILGLARPWLHLRSSVSHRFLYLVFKEFKVVWRTPVVLWPPADVGNLVHFLLRHVHVPDINMDLVSLPSGFENMVVNPWQWTPPPLWLLPIFCRAWHPGWLIMLAHFCWEFVELLSLALKLAGSLVLCQI